MLSLADNQISFFSALPRSPAYILFFPECPEATNPGADLPDAENLARLVDLNHARAAEAATGHIRWLRPGNQAGASVPMSD
jgi:hypothetical protein